MILEDARAALDRHAWADAFALYVAEDARAPLAPEDLDRLAIAAYLTGRDDACIQARTRAHAQFLESGNTRGAAQSAFWLGFIMMEKPAHRAQAAGWLARARRLIEDLNEPCVECAWLLCATARQHAAAGEFATAHSEFTEAVEMGTKYGDRDLVALARHGQGRSLLMLGRISEGLALLDEVMVAITGGEIAPMIAGAVYCSVISACNDLFELHRAHEWTSALETWCASQPDLVPFRGQCLIRRSEVMQFRGDWSAAMGEAARACERAADPSANPDAAAAHYQLAELHRLRGDFEKAEEAYRLASQAGRKPQPGLALLRLSQGQTDAADAAIRAALQETRDRRNRVLLLNAAVDIMLAKGDVAGARAASDELVTIARGLDLPFLRAVSGRACGAVALAEGQPTAALECLRAACAAWQELGAPYELARTRVLIGLAYRQLGDSEGAQLELDAASETFERLGAAPDAARVMSTTQPAPATSNLTGREIEVLRLIATGATNRAIASRLSISEKTVARHVSNIFTKLDLSSRSAATAYAYDHKLL